jgi:AraC-like DNA-binding protein
MDKRESIAGFYDRHGQQFPDGQTFNIYRREEFACDATSLPPNRRDFYKISFITAGEGIVGYADKTIHIKRPAITFLNPLIPYSWEPTTTDQRGYFCLFTEDFVSPELRKESLAQSPLFKVGGNHLLFPEPSGEVLLRQIFESMMQEIKSSYVNKFDLLRNYIQIVMHEALKIQPLEEQFQSGNAAERISSLFMELLELQFPIDSPHQVLQFKNANEFAAQLNIHTNHLNRALREATGKTTTEWISHRVMQEAKALLQHSSWDVAEIGYTLGFEHASNFNIFFKKHSALTPNQFRKACVAN